MEIKVVKSRINWWINEVMAGKLIELSRGTDDCSVHGQFDKNHKANYFMPNYLSIKKMTSIL